MNTELPSTPSMMPMHCLRMDGIASLQMPFGLMDLEALHGVFDKAVRAPIRDHLARVFRWRRIKTVPHRSRSACNRTKVGTRFADQAAS